MTADSKSQLMARMIENAAVTAQADAEKLALIDEAFAAGISLGTIARTYGTTVVWLQGWLRQARLERPLAR